MNKLSCAIKTIIVVSTSIYLQTTHAENKPTVTYAIMPITFIADEPFIDVMFNHYQAKIIVDLGTTFFDVLLSKDILDKSLAVSVGIQPKCFMKNYKGDKIACNNYLIKKVTIGNMVINNVKAIQFPGITHFSNDATKVSKMLDNGTLGIELLKKFSMIVDYPNKKIILIKDNKYPQGYDISHWHKLRIFYDHAGNIYSEVSINHHILKVLWDTGNTTATIGPEAARLIGIPVKCSLSLQQDNPNCLMILTSNFILHQHDYGKQELMLLTNKNKAEEISLGGGFFKNHVVYFNFQTNMMAIKQ